MKKMTKSLYQAVRLRSNSKKNSLIPVIVQFSNKSNRTACKRQAAQLKQKLGNRCRHIGHLWLVRCWAARVSPSALRTIIAHKRVAKVYLDRKNRINLNVATPAVGAAAAQRAGATGKGVGIAIIDSGVAPRADLTRPANRIRAFKDFVNGRTKPYDDNGHGTHVAGDAAGNGFASGGKYKGAAPQASIIAVKVLDSKGSGSDSVVIRGIQWCIANRKRLGIRVLNLSFGKPALEPCADDPVCQAIGKAVKAGLVVTVSAGNDGPDEGTVSSPGISPFAITVGAVDDQRTVRRSDDKAAAYSGRGPAIGGLTKPDLLAPGSNIVSLNVPGSVLERENFGNRVGNNYIGLTGTSFAAPIVAGTAAQLLQKRPGLRPAEVKELLKRNAMSLQMPANTQGAGELDVRFIADE